MRKCVAIIMLTGLLSVAGTRAKAQADELIQLALNIEKLAQLKSILNQLYSGYTMLSKGYTKIRDVANGNYALHQVFLDGLYAVSPTIKQYRRIPDIISYQAKMVSEYKSAYRLFVQSKVFDEQNLKYFKSVYNNLLEQSAANLDELVLVVTANKMRMSDDERLAAVDRIFNSVQDKLLFLRDFNSSGKLLAFQKLKEKGDLSSLKNLYGQ